MGRNQAVMAIHRRLQVSADISIFKDRSFELSVKSPATTSLLLQGRAFSIQSLIVVW